jgi:hypothetical protein
MREIIIGVILGQIAGWIIGFILVRQWRKARLRCSTEEALQQIRQTLSLRFSRKIEGDPQCPPQ